MKRILTLFLILSFALAYSQPVINTVVGNGYIGQINFNGQPGTSVECYPTAIAVDYDSNAYYYDAVSSTLQEWNYGGGTVTQIAGPWPNIGIPNTGYAGDGSKAGNGTLFNGVLGLCVDDSFNIYIADSRNFVVRKIWHNSGEIETILGVPGVSGTFFSGGLADTAHLGMPYSLALDDSANLYVGDQGNEQIIKVFQTTGRAILIAGTGGTGFAGDGGKASTAQFNSLEGIAVDDSSNIYVADRNNNRIRKIYPHFAGVSLDSIWTVAGNGTAGFTGDGSAAGSAELNLPCSVAVDDSSNIYIADQQNNRIRKVKATTLVITTICGTGLAANTGDSGIPTSASLNLPYAIAASGLHFIWTGVNGYRLRRFTHN